MRSAHPGDASTVRPETLIACRPTEPFHPTRRRQRSAQRVAIAFSHGSPRYGSVEAPVQMRNLCGPELFVSNRRPAASAQCTHGSGLTRAHCSSDCPPRHTMAGRGGAICAIAGYNRTIVARPVGVLRTTGAAAIGIAGTPGTKSSRPDSENEKKHSYSRDR